VQAKRPFLKWAGAKTKLLHAISAAAPRGAQRCVEPFVGSGTVALNLGLSQNLLADTNHDLMSVYSILQQEGEGFIETCAPLFTPENNSKQAFHALRDEFNGTTDARRKAALFIFLNRHGYNGLCRYNTKGRLNVPFGRYEHPQFPRERMRTFHAFLQTCELQHADFRAVIARTSAGDFVYCDPPYLPASDTANFTTYSRDGFSARDHADLVTSCREASARGAWVVVSNHDTPITRELYREADEFHELNVARRISCQSETRHHVRELLAVFRPRGQTTGTDPPEAA
jgi:DNA adenine methylase